MAERFSDTEKPFVIHRPSLEERLKEYPELKAMGNEVLHSWGRRPQPKKEAEYNAKPGRNRKEKNSLVTRLGKSK